MKTPHRFVPAHPWSPVGYQVVQTAEENVPATNASRTVRFQEDENELGKNGPTDDWRRRRRRPSRRMPIRANNLQLVWLIVPVGLLAVFLSMGIFLYAQSRTAVPHRVGMVQNGLRQDGLMIHDNGREVVIPEIQKDGEKQVAEKDAKQQPAAKVANDAPQILLAINAAPVICPPKIRNDAPLDDERFGTEVRFVRNAQEAKERATKQHKLVFMMHVSGNFEDEQFT